MNANGKFGDVAQSEGFKNRFAWRGDDLLGVIIGGSSQTHSNLANDECPPHS